MRALKLTLAFMSLLVLIRYANVYYRTSEFDDFVRHEAQRTRVKDQLKRQILNKAKVQYLPVQENDINITMSGPVFRVAVDYRVPLDLFIYNHELRFHASGSGLLRE